MKITQIYVELGNKKFRDFQGRNNSVGLRGQLEADDEPVVMVKKLQGHCYKLLLKWQAPEVTHDRSPTPNTSRT